MEKIEIIVRPEKVPHIKALLAECNASGAMFTSIAGYGNQRNKQYTFGGQKYSEQIFPKTKVETIVSDDVANELIKRILKEIPTGEIGDGKIFIYDVKESIRIRTGEHGEKAL